MMTKTIELKMSNINNEPVDLLHRVISSKGTVWANPFNQGKSIIDQGNNYKKYKHRLSNLLFLKAEPFFSEYNALIERAIKDSKLVFECTCYPAPCHMDAIRELLMVDLVKKNYKITTNQKPFVFTHKEEED